MSAGYIAICYVCNERCRYCPCGREEMAKRQILPFARIAENAGQMAERGVDRITISGGEPTLHPDILKILSMLQARAMDVTLLTNAERFSEAAFFAAFSKCVRRERFRVITTLHDADAAGHEAANGTPGSFARSLAGLHALVDTGFRVTIKHCITRENYRGLAAFYRFIAREFCGAVELQFCGIDYSGIPAEMRETEVLPFPELRPYLEKMFDAHARDLQNFRDTRKPQCEESGRKPAQHKNDAKSGANVQDSVGQTDTWKEPLHVMRIQLINLPLCAADPCYWNRYFHFKEKVHYSFYRDPEKKEIVRGQDNAGIDTRPGSACASCLARDICPGTYFSAFEYFGERIVAPVR